MGKLSHELKIENAVHCGTHVGGKDSQRGDTLAAEESHPRRRPGGSMNKIKWLDLSGALNRDLEQARSAGDRG